MFKKLFAIYLLFLLSNMGITAQENPLFLQLDSLEKQGEVFSAIALLERALVQPDMKERDRAKALYHLSYQYLVIHNFSEATRFNKQSLHVNRTINSMDTVRNFMRFGTIQLEERNFEQALHYYFKAKACKPTDKKLKALLHGYLANCYTHLQQKKKAEFHHQKAIDNLVVRNGLNDGDVSTAIYNKGVFYLNKRGYFKAERCFLRCLDIEKNIDFSNENPRLAKIYNALGVLIFELDRDKEAALDYHNKAYHRLSSKYGAHHLELARTNSHKAEVFNKTSDRNAALKLIQLGISNLCPNFESELIKDNPSVDELVLDKIFLVQLLRQKAKYLRALFIETKEVDLLDQVIDLTKLTIQFVEQIINTNLNEEAQLRLLEKHHDIYEEGIAAALTLSQVSDKTKYMELAFHFSEKSKVNILRRKMNELMTQNTMSIPSSISQKEEELKLAISYFESKLSKDPENSQVIDSLLLKKEQQAKYLAKLEKQFPDYYKLRFNTYTSTIKELQATLDDEKTILSYYVGNDRYYIFGINKDTFDMVAMSRDSIINLYKVNTSLGFKSKTKKLKKLGEIGTSIYSEFNSLGAPVSLERSVDGYLQGIRKMNLNQYTYYAFELYEKLVKPLSHIYKKRDQLIIIPHGNLHFLPFEALLTKANKDKAKYHKLKYLIQSKKISYHHSASLYYQLKLKKTQTYKLDNFLGVAPIFSARDNEGYIWDSHSFVFDTSFQKDPVVRATSPDGKSFKELKYSENEVVSIAKLFAQKEKDSKAFLHQEASEVNFKKEIKNYKYIHLATHSFINDSNPKFSGVAFNQSISKKNTEDGILYGAETFFLDMNADLVVLSSCESGLGRLVPGEGVISLTRGFLYAGSSNIVCSLWKVYDKYTSELMIHFYEEILDEKTYSEALREAKLKMIKDRSMAHPRKWSGFILIGE